MNHAPAALAFIAAVAVADVALACRRPLPVFYNDLSLIPSAPERAPYRPGRDEFVGVGRVVDVEVETDGGFSAVALIDRELTGTRGELSPIPLGGSFVIRSCSPFPFPSGALLRELEGQGSVLFFGVLAEDGEVGMWGVLPMSDPDADWVLQSLTAE